MKIIEKTHITEFPLKWFDLDYFPNTKSERTEIYLIDSSDYKSDLALMFYGLFGSDKENILIFVNHWWDLCLDTFNILTETSNYTLKNKSEQTQNYLSLLMNSEIPEDYTGVIKCNNWDKFLEIVLDCILSHMAPYSPLFFNKEQNYIFYFHHTGSIGLYYNNRNDFINKLLKTAEERYDLEY